ncbi:MAG: hypothetical protein P4L84_13595 [Isosphaeraceae bacterium]|nr:hypothetical protein [Isosphaeraceae bacterium]
MKIRLVRRLVWLGAGAWIALLASGVLAPATARAGCTHYVLLRDQGTHGGVSVVNSLELLSPAELPGAGERSRRPVGFPSPCSGLSCSRNPMPPMAPAPAGLFPADAWACLNFAPSPATLPSLACMMDRCARRPVHFAFPPDRPPRTA